ncbi:uncharacterized protein Z520_07125 [Fonsecaea multimorphosa CBS 102226]|uniref:Uncharacterized protein n=1 Tax=Fonsecaea multimorphosa CBS 102226 TaxID=1442371 RepID=A0A0D2IJ06_9EURO|nr:uncharacterized protein Z520_07125 [Fonsecaea multimorphosa CBS 102226]KIX97011.1 hypothetical protein Z520_07125 [Fonsecaea multimorphosa CBS 102226]
MNATSDSSWPAWLSVAGVVLSYTLLILSYALYPVFLLLRAIWYILASLSAPFIYMGRVVAHFSLIPWRIFAAFEPVWYFLGSAVLLGLLFALALHFTMRIFVVVFRLDRSAPQPIPARGHDAVSYRKAREAKKRKQLDEQQRLAAEARLIASQPLLQEVPREPKQYGTKPAGPFAGDDPGT